MTKHKIITFVDDEIHQWLEAKASRGYKKSSFVRTVLHRQMEFEKRDRSRQPELGQVATLR